MKQFERAYSEQLLVTFDGNVTHAAQEARKNRRAFIELDRFRSAKSCSCLDIAAPRGDQSAT